ncbi:glycoside hydrolase superfamily [Limtongia smithiae]|uniref:glycoside hydrolase superfamily n=1 Tax=Limtongia smithiae TaxID=1125753 RepID=UPI0034CD7981
MARHVFNASLALLLLLASLASLVAAEYAPRRHSHHKHRDTIRRDAISAGIHDTLPDILEKRDSGSGDCNCITYVVGGWVDYVPPAESSSVSYSSTVIEYLYVTVVPSATADSAAATTTISTLAKSTHSTHVANATSVAASANTTSTHLHYNTTTTAYHANATTVRHSNTTAGQTTTLLHNTTTMHNISKTTSALYNSTWAVPTNSSIQALSTTSSSSAWSAAITASSPSTSTSSTSIPMSTADSSSIPLIATITTSSSIWMPTSASTTSDDVTSTFYSTVTVFVTITPIFSTYYSTTTAVPGVYIIDNTYTTTLFSTGLLEFAYSTQTIIPTATSASGVVTSYVAASEPTQVLRKRQEAVVHAPVETPAAKARPWAIAYSPYTSVGGCKADAVIKRDMAVIASKGFRAVRIYSTDCGLNSVISPAAAEHGLRLILGLSINDSGVECARQQLPALMSFSYWSLVDLVVVGNEAVFNEFVTASELSQFIDDVRRSLRDHTPYVGPVTTAETPTVLQNEAAILCPIIDVVGVNVHPFFDSTVSPRDAGAIVKSISLSAHAACGRDNVLPVVVLETGWPHSGDSANGNAIPGAAEQVEAIASIRRATDTDSNVVFFTYTDDEWKQPGAFGVEQRFGAIDAF